MMGLNTTKYISMCSQFKVNSPHVSINEIWEINSVGILHVLNAYLMLDDSPNYVIKRWATLTSSIMITTD